MELTFNKSNLAGATQSCVRILSGKTWVLLTVIACLFNAGMATAAYGQAAKVMAMEPLGSVVLRSDGTVWAWGQDIMGETGDYIETIKPPVYVSVPMLMSVSVSNITKISSGGYNNLFAFSSNFFQIFPATAPYPPSVTGNFAVYPFTLLLRNDGLVFASGCGGVGQLGDGGTDYQETPHLVNNLSNVVDIAAGAMHVLALRADGTVWSWGYNADGELGNGLTSNSSVPVAATKLTNIVAIAAGTFHSLALRADGTIWSWGYNGVGELGNGQTSSGSLVPIAVTNLTNIVAIAAGPYQSMALRADGIVWSWGEGGNGELGNGLAANSSVPVAVINLSNVTMIAKGSAASLALRQDGTVWAWGYNGLGELGNGTTTQCLSPVQVTDVYGAISIAAGMEGSMVLLNNGVIGIWGNNLWGELGDDVNSYDMFDDPTYDLNFGYYSAAYSPVPCGVDLSVTVSYSITPTNTIAAYIAPVANDAPVELLVNHQTVLAKADGTVYAWGYNGFGGLGDGTVINRSSPEQIGNFVNVTQTSVGGAHTLVLTAAGLVWGWGENNFGQLGCSITNHNTSVPVLITNQATLPGIRQVSAGGQHSLALDTNGFVWSWGGNFYGQLGNGSITNSYLPNQINKNYLANITSIAAGGEHSLALGANGTVYGWGDNLYGQVGNGNYTNQLTPVIIGSLPPISALAAGDDHSLALGTNGNVYAWGYNVNGQLGNGTTTNSASPVLVSGLSGIASVGAGVQFSVALATNGTVWAWGLNASGQLGDGTTTTRLTPVQVIGLTAVIGIQVFGDHVVATLADGSVRVWGADQLGQLGIGWEANQIQTSPEIIPGFYVILPAFTSNSLNVLATNDVRFVRGNGNDFTYKSFVIPLDSEQGVKLDDLGSNSENFNGAQPWFTRIANDVRHHIGLLAPVVTNANGSQVSTYGWTNDFQNPIVAFGSSGGGSSLSIGQAYRFGIYAGAQYESTNSNGAVFAAPIRILVYRKSDFLSNTNGVISAFATNYITVPRQTIVGDQTAWNQFLNNGLMVTISTNNLTTVLQLVAEAPSSSLTNGAGGWSTNTIIATNLATGAAWSESTNTSTEATGVNVAGLALTAAPTVGAWGVAHSFTNALNGPFILTQTAGSPDYCYVVEALGVFPSGTNASPAVMNTARTNLDWCRLYSIDFDNPAPWQSVFVSAPQFNGQPLPPQYLGATPLELTNLTAMMTNVVALTSPLYTNLDNSPELRRNPTLDQFVASMRNDPIALANYVQNQIQLCDALSYNEQSGNASAPTITQASIQLLSSGVIGIFTSPFILILLTLVYYDIRIRREAFDIEMLAQSL